MGKITDKRRYVNTRFWADNWVVDHLNPLDRYLFLYLLTNDRTNIAGVYELSTRRMAFDTGIEERDIKSMLRRMQPKVFYVDGFVILKNSNKHQDVENPKIKAGIDKILESVPSKVLTTLLDDSLSLPIDTQSHSDLDLDSDLDSNISSNDSAKSDDLALLFNELRGIFGVTERFKFSEKRRRQLKTRLKEFTREEILAGAKELSLSDFHTGGNPNGTVFADPEWYTKSYERVEQWVLRSGKGMPDPENRGRLKVDAKSINWDEV